MSVALRVCLKFSDSHCEEWWGLFCSHTPLSNSANKQFLQWTTWFLAENSAKIEFLAQFSAKVCGGGDWLLIPRPTESFSVLSLPKKFLEQSKQFHSWINLMSKILSDKIFHYLREFMGFFQYVECAWILFFFDFFGFFYGELWIMKLNFSTSHLILP